MSTVTMNGAMAMNRAGVNEKTSLAERFKNYILDNAAFFAAGTAMMTGNGYAAAQIMIDAKRSAEADR